MTHEHRLWLDTNREHLFNDIQAGCVRGLIRGKLYEIMTANFIPTYGTFDDDDYDAVVRVIKDVYVEYDKWLAAQAEKKVIPGRKK